MKSDTCTEEANKLHTKIHKISYVALVAIFQFIFFTCKLCWHFTYIKEIKTQLLHSQFQAFVPQLLGLTMQKNKKKLNLSVGYSLKESHFHPLNDPYLHALFNPEDFKALFSTFSHSSTYSHTGDDGKLQCINSWFGAHWQKQGCQTLPPPPEGKAGEVSCQRSNDTDRQSDGLSQQLSDYWMSSCLLSHRHPSNKSLNKAISHLSGDGSTLLSPRRWSGPPLKSNRLFLVPMRIFPDNFIEIWPYIFE